MSQSNSKSGLELKPTEGKRNLWTAPKLVRLNFAATAASTGVIDSIDSIFSINGSNS